MSYKTLQKYPVKRNKNVFYEDFSCVCDLSRYNGRMKDEVRDAAWFEKKIGERVKEIEGLVLGYIGNFERWGDDRKLFIWVQGMRNASNTNTVEIWSCTARFLDQESFRDAMVALRGFETALKYVKWKQEKEKASAKLA